MTLHDERKASEAEAEASRANSEEHVLLSYLWTVPQPDPTTRNHLSNDLAFRGKTRLSQGRMKRRGVFGNGIISYMKSILLKCFLLEPLWFVWNALAFQE